MNKIIVIFFIGLSSFLANAQVNQNYTAVRFYIHAETLMQTGQFQEAYQYYSNAISADSEYAQAYMKRGIALERMGKYEQALKDYDRALGINPHLEFIRSRKAKVKILAADFRGAQADIEAVVTNRNCSDSLLEYCAGQFMEIGQYDLAEQEIDSLLIKNPDDPILKMKKVYVLQQQNDFQSAEEILDSLLLQYPENSLIQDLMGMNKFANERFYEAMDYFDRAIALDSSFYIAYFNKALVLDAMGRKEAALLWIDKAIEKSQKASHLYFDRALLKKDFGDLEGAEKDYSRAISIDEEYSNALFNRAITRKMLGNYREALRDVNLLIERQPMRPDNYNLRGNIRQLFGDLRDAIDDYDRAINMDDEYAEAYLNRALAYISNGQNVLGCADLEMANILGREKAEEYMYFFCDF